jgi:monofunctional biosynthetic peptidoglycan transglycosylase
MNSDSYKKVSWLHRLIYVFAVLVILTTVFYVIVQISLPDVSYLISKIPSTTALIEQRKSEAQNTGRAFKPKYQWVSFQNIPDLLKKTIRISEDANFYFHNGVDFEELEASLKMNIEKGGFVRGGSTITQQLAKNLFLSTEKSIRRKIEEYFIAKELESTLSKQRIFHIYLNVIELGRGVFGVSAASQYYFHKPVGDLTLEEIIRLTAVIPRPLTVRPIQDSQWILWRCRWITKKLLLYKYIDKSEHDRLHSLFSPQ